MRAGEGLQERDPIEVAAGLLLLEARALPRIDRLRDLQLFLDGAGGSSPAVVVHHRVGDAGADLPILRPDAKALGALVGPDVLAQPHAAHFAPVPAAARRDGVEASIEVEVLHQQALHPLVAVARRDGLLQDARAAFVPAFIGLQVTTPTPPAAP